MHRLRLLTLSSLAVLTSCTPPDTALRVNVTVRTQGTARVRADCLRLTISNDTQELKSLTIKRPTDDDAVFAVRRGSDLPASVKVQATGFLGNCADDSTLKLNAQGESVIGVFPESGVSELSVFLDPPGSGLDADRDGYVAAAKGGLDCRDDDNAIFPGASQVCTNTSDTDCDGQGGCDDSECGSAAICADPPDRVRVSTIVATMLRYECRGPFRVELRNAAGTRVAIRDTAVALASSLPGVTVHGVSSCTDAALGSLTIPYGESFFDVFLKADGQAFGNTTLTATAAQVATPGTAVVEVHPQPLDHLVFTSPPRTVSAGQCSAEEVTLEFRDAMNRRTDVDSPTTVTLASAPGDINNANIFFSDAACATDGSMKQLLPGQGSIALRLNASRAGSFTLTATPSAGGGPQTQPLTVQPAGATQLAFTNNPLVLSTTQSCSAGQFTLQLQDQFQNPVTPAADLPIRITVSGLSNVELFTASSMCSAAAQSDFVIPAGFNSVSVRARGMTASATAGEVRATVLNGAAIADATQALRISAGFASKFILTGSAQSPLASVCSASPFSVELLDSANNPASASTAVSFTLTTVPAADASFRFYSGAGCQTDLGSVLTVPAGQTGAQFYYRGNKAVPTFEIRASSALTAPSTFLSGNSIRPGVPAKLQYGTTAPFGALQAQTAQAGICSPSPYVATVLDLFDNPTSFTNTQEVTINSNPAGVTAGAAACDSGNTVTLNPGVGQVSFIARHTVTTAPATPYALTATVNGFTTPTAATLAVTPGQSTLMVDVPSGPAVLAAGGCQQITLTRRDGFNNNAPTPGNTPLTLSFPGSTTWLVYPNAGCTGPAVAPSTLAMNSTHTITFSVSPRTSGNHMVSASIVVGTMQTALLDIRVSPGMANLVFEVPNTNVGTASATQTAGGCTPVTVARKDSFGNDVPLGSAQDVSFPSLPGGTTIHTGTPCVTGTGGNAISALSLTATDARASFYVRANTTLSTGGPVVQTVVASLATQSATLSLTVNPGNPMLSLIVPTGGAATVSANTCVPVTLERRDSQANLVPVASATNVTIAPQTNLTIFTSTDCTGGTVTQVPVTAGASSRAFSVRSTVAGSLAPVLTLVGQDATLTLTVNPGPLSQLNVLGLPGSMIAGACVGPITVRRRDAWNNTITNGATSVDLSSSQFTFSAASDCSAPAASLAVAIADGQSVSGAFYVRATLAPTASLTATLGTVTGTGSLTVTPDSSTLAMSVIVPTSGTTTVTANTCVPVTVERRDSFTNLVPLGSTMNLTVTPTANLSAFSATDCTGTAITNVSVASGASSRAFSVRSTVAAAYALTATLDGKTAPLSLTVTPAATSQVAVLGLPASMTSGGCVGPITVRRRDAFNNDTSAGTVSVNMTSAQFQFSTATDCSGAAASLMVGITDGQSNSSAFYATATQAGTPTMTATLGTFIGTGSLTVNPGPGTQLAFTTASRTFTAGTCGGSGGVITVQLRDAAGNATNALTGGQALTAVSTSGTGLWFTNTGCSSAAAGGGFTIAAGSSSVSLYYRDTTAGSITVTLTNLSSLSNPAGQTHTVNPGAASKLVFLTPVRTFTAAQCGGAANVITVQLQDTNGNPVNAAVGGQAFTAASNSSGTVGWFTDDTCATSATSGAFLMAAGTNSISLYYRDSKAGTPQLSLTNSSGLTNPTAQVHTVQPGAPARLGFTSGAQTLAALACSAVTTASLQDLGGNVVNTGADRVITFSAAPLGANTTFYSDASCATPLAANEATMTTGTSAVTVYFKAEGTGTVTLTAASAGLTSGTQNETLTAAAATKLVWTTSPPTVEAGFCQALTVERQDALSRATAPASATTITPSSSPSTGISFFSNATCTTALGATFNISSGASTATVYAKGVSGSLTGVIPGSQAYTVTATSNPLTPHSVDVTVLPMVRRRNSVCTLSNASSVTCPITPTLASIDRTVLFFQAAANQGDSPDDDNVTCKLDPNGGVAQVVCQRNGTGVGTSTVDIEWQTLSFPAGGPVSVQHVSGGCVAAATIGANGVMNTTITNAPGGTSFVLFSSRTAGADNDAEHFFTARLTSSTNLQFAQATASTTCTRTVNFEAQVVTWAGSTVGRGVKTGGANDTYTDNPSTSGQTFLLYSARLAAADLGAGNICRRRLRGEITSGSLLTFNRGCTGGDIQDIAWETVRLPTGGTVQQVTGTTNNNGATAGITFTSVDLTRTVIFMGGQGPGGSATGSSTVNSADRIGSAQATALPTSATGADLTRRANDLVGSFTAYVMQLTP